MKERNVVAFPGSAEGPLRVLLMNLKRNIQHDCNPFVCFLAYSAAWVWQRCSINQGWKSYFSSKNHIEKGRGVEENGRE